MAKGSQSGKADPGKQIITWGEDKYQIAIIGPGYDVDKEDKIQIANLVCLMYATDKHTLKDCLKKCGVKSEVTWYTWRREIEEIEVLFQEAKKVKSEIYTHNLQERARTAAERLLEGFTVDLVDKVEEKQADGSWAVTAKRTRQSYQAPRSRLVEVILYNLDGNNFIRNPEPYQGGNEEIPTDINVNIVGGDHLPAVTNEDDINEDI